MNKNSGALYTLPKSLRKLAAKWINDMPVTRAERNAAVMSLPSRDGLKRDEARELCENAAKQGKVEKIKRLNNKISLKIGRSAFILKDNYTNAKTGRQSEVSKRAIITKGSTEVRLVNRICSIVLENFRQNYRYPSEGHGDEIIEISQFPGFKQEQSDDWNLYKGKWKGSPALVTDTTIFVCRNYLTNIYLKGITVVENMLIIDVELYEIAAKAKIYAAKWLKQSRGYSIVEVDGYVAVNERGAKRGDTPEQALRKLNRLTVSTRRS
jgi:hypothetical protein